MKGYIKLRYIFDNHYFLFNFFKGLNVGITYNCNVNNRGLKIFFLDFLPKKKIRRRFLPKSFFWTANRFYFLLNYNVFVNNITLFY